MAIAYVGGATAVSVGNTDVSVSLTALTGGSGSAAIAGDLVIFAYNIADADNVNLDLVCNTAGFAEAADLFGDGAEDANLGVYYKFMTTPPDTAVVGEGSLGGTDTAIQASVMVFRGVAPVAVGGPFDVAATTATGTTTGDPVPASINTTGAAGIWTVIVGACAHTANVNGTFTGPTNYTTDFLTIGNQDTADGIIGMGYNSAPSDPEAPGTITTATTATGWCAVTMALKEAAAVAAGDLAVTEAPDVFAAAGDVVVAGALAATEVADTAAFAGDVIVAGVLVATESSDVAALTGDVVVAGDLAITEAADAFAASGAVSAGGIAGDFSVTEAPDTLSAVGSVLVAGAFAATDPTDVAALAGVVIVAGDLAAVEAQDVALIASGEVTLGRQIDLLASLGVHQILASRPDFQLLASRPSFEIEVN